MYPGPDPDEYFEHVLRFAVPWDQRRRDTPTDAWLRWWLTRDARSDLVTLLASRQGWVLTTAQLRDLGVLDHDIRRHVRRGEWSRPARGVVSPVNIRADDEWLHRRRGHAIAAAAAALRHPDHVVDGRSAAILYGLPTLAVPGLPELTGPGAGGRRDRVHVHAVRLRITETRDWFGVPVATPARVLVDLARRSADDAIMAADAALRAGVVTRGALDDALVATAGWPFVSRAREVVALASALAESPLESVTRLRLHDGGFPAPQLQVPIAGYVTDAGWMRWGIVLECDGRGKYTDDELWRERRHDGDLRAAGVRVVERVTWRDVTPAAWPGTRARLAALFPAGVVKDARGG